MDLKRKAMISEGVIKTKYVKEILERDAKYINEIQTQVISETFRQVTGRLLRSMYRKDYALEGYKDHMFLQFNFLRYLRFLDIKSSQNRFKDKKLRAKLALYNRVIWGRIYNETLNDLRFGLTEEIKSRIKEELEK